MTLLEQAQAVPLKRRRHRFDCGADLIALAVAFVAGNVTATQAAVVLQMRDGAALQKLARALREAVKRGLVRPPAMRVR